MNRLTTPCLLLSTLLIGTNYGADWTINNTQTKNINNQTINGVDLTKQGNLTVNSQGTSEIKAMSMFFLQNGAGATFNVQSGSLKLDLGLVNTQGVRNNVTFNVRNNSTLTLTNGQNGRPLGIFQGSSTNLIANINNNSTLKGHLSNNGTTRISITQNSKMEGDIRQNGGTIDATLEGKLTGSIILTSNTQKASLWANKTNGNTRPGSTTITGNIIQQSQQLEGIMKGLNLEGNFTQTGGTSDIAFHSSEFKNTTTLAGGNALLHFYDTTLQSITATSGTNTINLKGVQGTGANGSHMKDYTGINSNTTLNLIENSSMQSASQKGGRLTIDARDSAVKGSITGDSATLNVTLTNSNVTGNISNSQSKTTINTNKANIGGSITQNEGTLHAILNQTTIKGSITQIGGEISRLIATDSKIQQGIYLNKVTNNNRDFDIMLTKTTVDNGFFIENAQAVTLAIINDTTINGGYQQTGGAQVIIRGANSKINGGIQVKNGNGNDYMTFIDLSTSEINGGIISNNHTIKVLLTKNSTAQDRINITGGKGYFKGSVNSSFTGDLISQNTTDTQLHLIDNSKLIGNVSQRLGTQQINLQTGSIITGSITNTTQVQATITLQTRSKLEGDLTQNSGKLFLGIGGDSTIVGNVKLDDVTTTLTNGQTTVPKANIQGNFTQNNGSLTGRIGGLTLQGIFTQNGGTSDITFWNATFQNPTTINNAILSKINFDNKSNLKDYTINNSNNVQNTLSLNHETTLHGNFTLKNSNAILRVLNDSKITGNVISKDANNKLKIDMQSGGAIGGNLEIEKGEISGTINSGTIGGDIKLTDATSNLKFTASTINGNVHIIRGKNEISLNSTTIGGWFKMEEVGPDDPTLKLKISNKSSIGGDLTFMNTKAFLGGEGTGNIIKGNLISKNSTLSNGTIGGGWYSTISGLTIAKDLQQEKGSLDLIMENQSNIQGKTSIQTPNKFHLMLKNQSSMGKFEITGGTDNELTLSNQSKQNNDMTLTDTKITIKALQNSSITSNISVVSNNNFASETKIYLNQSSLTGNLIQSSGSLLLDYANQSKMTGDLTLSNIDPAQIKLNNSEISGLITATQSKVSIDMNNGSKIQTKLNSASSNIILNANASTLSGEIQHTGDAKAQAFELKFNFTNGAKFENTKTSLVGTMKIEANGSIINSEEINLILGKLNITMDNSSGVIKHLQTGGDNQVSIVTSNASNSSITKLEIKDSANLSLVARSAATIAGELMMKNKATASIQSLENALVKFDISLANQANLDITLSGGKLQGKITQNGTLLGNATLGSAGQFGGRWIMTESSNLKSLTINNSQANVDDKVLMLMGVENSPISMVDMTKDPLGASRIGLEITGLGNPQNNQTTARVLSLSNLNGQNGVFRVYTDLGTGLSDKITTQTATGSHIIQVYYNPATFTKDLTGKHIVIAHVDDTQTTANFVGGYTEVGNQAYQTDLLKVTAAAGGFDWILGNAKQAGPSYGTKVIASILQSQYRSFAIQTETLNQRLGELKNIHRISGFWARYSLGSNQTKETQTHIKVQDNFYSTWIGYDQNSVSLRGQNFFGFALSHTLVSPDSKDYTGSIHNIGFNFYNVFLARNDFYFDIVAKYILTHGSYDISYASLSKNSPKYLNHKLMINLEIGKKFKLTEGETGFFYIQPEGQITSGYIHGNDLKFTDLSNTTIDANLSYSFPVLMRAGLVGAYALEYSSFKADFRFGTSFIYEVKTGGDVRLDDGNSIVKYGYTKDLHLLFQAGTNIIINDSSRIYLEASTGFLGITNTTYAFNAGVRFTFGPKNTRKLKVPTASNPPPPPKPEYDPRNIPVITDNTKQDIKNNKQYETQPRYTSDYFINTRRNFRDVTSLRQ